MEEVNLLKARKKQRKKGSTPNPLLFLKSLFKLLIICSVALLLLYLLTLGISFVLQQQVTASQKTPIKTYTHEAAINSQHVQVPYGTDSEIASIAAQVPVQQDVAIEKNSSTIPSNLLIQITDEVSKITIYRLIDTLSAYWLDTQRFPVSRGDDSHAWIQQMQDIGDLNPIYATYLSKISADPTLCNAPSQNGLCYISDGQKAILSIPLLSTEEKALCPNGTTFFEWSSVGKIGISCR